MTVGIENLGAVYQPPAAPSRTRFEPSVPVDPLPLLPEVDRVELSDLVPPPEVLEEVELASGRVLELAAQDRELHFAKDEASGRIVVEVRDLAGNVIRVIPGAEALDVMSGAPLR